MSSLELIDSVDRQQAADGRKLRNTIGVIEAAHGPVVDVRSHYLPPIGQALDVENGVERYVLVVGLIRLLALIRYVGQ